MAYHDTMFASSDLANTLQERIDISVANGLKKVYIGKPYSLAFKVGEPVLVYRKYTGTDGLPGYAIKSHMKRKRTSYFPIGSASMSYCTNYIHVDSYRCNS